MSEVTKETQALLEIKEREVIEVYQVGQDLLALLDQKDLGGRTVSPDSMESPDQRVRPEVLEVVDSLEPLVPMDKMELQGCLVLKVHLDSLEEMEKQEELVPVVLR